MAPPNSSAFKQQTLKAWRPILTPKLVILLFALGGLIFIPVGVIVIGASNGVTEIVSEDYSASCCIANCDSQIPWERVDANPCTVTITVPTHMEPPIYMYYKLTDFYQNHRRYVRSRSDEQLRGDAGVKVQLPKLSDSSSCRYHVSNTHGGAVDGDQSIISPCGLIAWSVFNDSFSIAGPGTTGAAVTLNETGIAWPSDLEYKFANAESGQTGQNYPQFAYWRNKTCDELPDASKRAACVLANTPYTGALADRAVGDTGYDETSYGSPGWCFKDSGYCAEDEHFIVWMRAAGLPNFRKLYGKIETRLEPGTYTINVTNGYDDDGDGTYVNGAGVEQRFLYPVSSFGGTKAIVLSTTSWLGGRNFFLGYAYVIVGVVSIVLSVCFAIKHHMNPRELGHASYISWQHQKAEM